MVEVMQMKHHRSVWVVTLAAAMTLYGGDALWAASIAGRLGPHVYAAAGGGSSHGRQGYLGVETKGLSDDELPALKLKELHGVEIVNLDHDGPACKAGMRMHDVILQMNGQAIDGEEQMRRMLKVLPAGRNVSVVISRDGQTQTLAVQMADRRKVEQDAWEQHYSVPAPDAPYGLHGSGFFHSSSSSSSASASAIQTPKGHLDFLGTSMILSSSFTGAKLEVMGAQLAEFFGATDGAGLLVRSVDSNSPAAQAGMKAGDVVVRVNSLPVASGTEWTKTVHDYKGKPVPVVVLRDKHEQTLTLTPDAKKRSCLGFGSGLEEFFQETSQQTRELLAKL